MAKRVLPQGDPELPPPGDERREVLRERTDTLAEAAEALSEERGAVDPRAFEVENEVGQHFDGLEVPRARADYRYCWVQCGASWYGRFVNMKRSEGWEVVRAGDDDAPDDTTQVDNTCRVADVLLMRMRADRYILLQRKRMARQRAIETGSMEASALTEASEKYAKLGIQAGVADTSRLKTMTARSRAALLAQQQFEQKIRDGQVPGVPVAGGPRR